MRENDWDRREQKVQPREQDLFSMPAPQAQQADAAPAPQRAAQQQQRQQPSGGWSFDRRD